MMKALSVALTISMVTAAPAAAQTMTAQEARTQLRQYCTEAQQRTDEAGRTWYATNCSPEALARYERGTVNTSAAQAVGVLFLLGMVAAVGASR
jgi:hypothetical protein